MARPSPVSPFGHVRTLHWLAFAALAAGSACQEPTGPEREISGAKLFARHCARCHGPEGRGLPEVVGIRDLTDPNMMSTISDERIRGAILMGRPPTMPSFGFFSEPTVKVLAAYVRQLSQPDLVPPPAALPQ